MTASRFVRFVMPALGGLLLMGAAHAAPAQCPQQVDVRNVMTVTEFYRAGLNKLDQTQLEAFNGWLSRHVRSLCGRETAGASGAANPAQCPRQVDVRSVMTVSEFHAVGLDKFDKTRIASLDAWLGRYIQNLCAQTNTPIIPSAAGAATPPHGPPTGTATENGRGQTVAPSPDSADVANFGAPPKPIPNEPGRIESRIIGDFYGWTGRTVFKLENGQVWVQAGPGYFRTHLKNPKVTIKKLLIGYVLLVEGYAKEVFVRRIR